MTVLSRLRELTEQFDAAHADGLTALERGDYEALAEALGRQRELLEEQQQLITEQLGNG